MSLPKSIQMQADRADQMLAANNPPVPPVGDTQGNQPVVADQESSGPVANAAEEATKDARYQTLAGKYNAEVPRLAQQVKETQAAMQSLLQENERLRTSLQPAAKPVQIVTDSEKEAFGPDLVDLMERVAKSSSAPAFADAEQIRKDNEQLRQQLSAVQEQQAISSKDRFVRDLTTAVPDWQSVNADNGFLRWLGETDPVYGLPRQKGLDHAYGNLDVLRVAHIFEAYKALSGTPARTIQQELQSQVAPTSSRGSVVPITDSLQGKIWTQPEIAQAYTDVRRGSLHGDAADRIMKDIDAALSEGRIR